MSEFSLIIDGKPVATQSSFGVINPATGEVFAECPTATVEHVDQAVAAARKAFATWSQTSDAERKQKIHAIADALEANMDELMQLLTKEVGRPLGGYQGIGTGMEVGGAIAWTRVTAETDLPVEVIQDNDEARVEVHHKPLGVVGSITPWNWPLMIAIWHVIPALRTGNTAIIKPSPYTPLTTLRFVQLANEILPPGVLNVVTGDAEVGNAITNHPGIDKIVFTGSTPTGKKIMESASGNLKRLTLELGGNDAGIVLPDVDPKAIAEHLFSVCFHNNGQTCSALKRLYVHENVYDAVCDELVALANSVKLGNGLEEGVDLGPLQNKAQLDIVTSLTDDAKARGARILCGGERLDGPGYFYKPTVVADIEDGAPLVDREQFGPVIPVIKYSDIDDAIARANSSKSGLGGSVWSSDQKRAQELVQRLECGTAWVNTHAAIQPDAPMGGVKESGFGVEFGRYGLAEYTSIQTVKVMK